LLADSQRTEISGLHAQVEALKVSVADYEHAVMDTEHRLTRERTEAEAAAKELTEARVRLGDFDTRVHELERQLFVQQTEAEVLNRRGGGVAKRLCRQRRMASQPRHP